MEEQSGSLIRRTRFSHSVYHRPEASRLDSISVTLQPRRTPRSNTSTPDSATISSRTRPTHVTQTQQIASDLISEPMDSQDFNDAAGSMQTPYSRRKEQKKGCFGKLLHKHSHDIRTTTSTSTSSSSDSTLNLVKKVMCWIQKLSYFV